MTEYRTQPLTRAQLLEELQTFCDLIVSHGVPTAELSFGWDSNLEIDQMWKRVAVAVLDVIPQVLKAESQDVVVVGKGDIIVAVGGVQLTLCHESDLHLRGEGPLANAVLTRWRQCNYSPSLVNMGQFKWPRKPSVEKRG